MPAAIDTTTWGRLDLNDATIPELEALPRIGPRLAERIVAARRQAGGFRRVEDLETVRGIGPATMRRLAPYVVVADSVRGRLPPPGGARSSVATGAGTSSQGGGAPAER